MPRVGLLNRIGGEETNCVNRAELKVVCHVVTCWLRYSILPSEGERYNTCIGKQSFGLAVNVRTNTPIIKRGNSLNNLTFIAKQFTLDGNVLNVKEFGNGNINDTYI